MQQKVRLLNKIKKVKIRFIIILVYIFISFNCIGQDKIVKIKSDSIFISFFYKSKKATRYTKNDTTYYLTKRVTDTSFMLSKYQKGKLVWSKKMQAIIAKDSLVVNAKMTDIRGKSKKKYYLGIEIP
jgi:hypothetical protein